jgi:hypothetical protein
LILARSQQYFAKWYIFIDVTVAVHISSMGDRQTALLCGVSGAAARPRRLPAVSYLVLTRVSGEQIELSAAFIVALSDFRLTPTLAWIASK